MSGSHHVDSSALPWRSSPSSGVTWKKLHHDATSGASAVLLKFEPGARYLTHRHPQGEEYFVLEGTLQDGANTWAAGAYVRHPPGSIHTPVSPDGCVVFVTLPAAVEIVPSD